MNSILSKLSLKDEEELYIPETESFIILKNYILETMPKTTQKAMINMALDLEASAL